VRLKAGSLQHTHKGLIRHDELIGSQPGCKATTHLGFGFSALKPSLYDMIMSIHRVSQIVYPKDLGYMLLKLSVGTGSRVIEAGTGSGALTIALAHAVQPTGRVYSYEVRDDMRQVAEKNLFNVGLLEYVDLKQRDIAEGFDERDVDALFLDVREPWLYLEQSWAALSNGGFFGSLVPTANQVSALLEGLERVPSDDIEVCEIILRPYKTIAARLRPVDHMIGHTGYLIFARRVTEAPAPIAVDEDSGEREAAPDAVEEQGAQNVMPSGQDPASDTRCSETP
jgi:tRNA (adenine57-N1/adenine58-N1)-methyltransferase